MRKTFQVHGRLEEDGVGFLRLEHPGQRFAEHLMTAPPQTGKKSKTVSNNAKQPMRGLCRHTFHWHHFRCFA